MKKFNLSALLALAMALCMAFAGTAMAESADAADTEFDPEALINSLTGSYTELFTTICAPEYDEVWLEKCKAVVGEENAEMVAEVLKSACTATIYGPDAVEAYTADPDSARFDCYFQGGVSTFVFEGNKLTGLDADDNEVFSHEYTYVKEIPDVIACHVYKTEDADAGEFTYLCLSDDSPAETYHIEFRYGDDVEALSSYYDGKYAYWLAAGILSDADEEMIDNCIELFTVENAGGDEEEAA